MKLDKIKFAQVIAYVQNYTNYMFDRIAIESLDDLIDIDVEPVALPINLSAIDGLMECMAEGTRKIEAIKYHRSLTGFGLKESKDAVEKYWRSDDKRLSKLDMIDKLKGFGLDNTVAYQNARAFIDECF